jgi:peptidoglycan/xylan/chitin deacetylase (PgdA/CDA1 family)
VSALRRILKSLVERAAASRAAVAAGLAARLESRIILAYHNVVDDISPPDSGDRSLHLPLHQFVQQLDVIAQIGLRVAKLGPEKNVRAREPEVVITFDDAYEGALRYAVPELARRGFPATVFVAPGLLGLQAAWWDRLADRRSGGVPSPIRERVLSRYRGEGHVALAAAAEEGWHVGEAASEHRIGSEMQLQMAMSQHPGLTLGNHTWSHPNLAAVASADEGAAVEQLVGTQRWLADRFGSRAIPCLAYPYGLESPLTRRIASQAALALGLRISGGWDNRRGDPFGVPRFNITPGLTKRGFIARVAGVLP